MYFIIALVSAVIAGVLWFFFKDRKGLHLDILALIFVAATTMWLVDCIYSAAGGEGFLSFEPVDGWISLFTLLGGLFAWLLVSFILNNKQKVEAK